MSVNYDVMIGPLCMRIILGGENVPLVGSYKLAEASNRLEPGAIVRANLSPGFLEGRKKRPLYPSFESQRQDDGRLFLSRIDAEGIVEVNRDGPVIGDFKGLASPHSLEALIRIVASIALPRLDALILHSSAVKDKNGGHVFSGLSGAGKSTIAQMLSDAYPLKRLSDELLLLVKRQDGWYVEVAPFTGKVKLPQGLSSPLQSINFLLQAQDNLRIPWRASQVMGELPQHILSYAKDPLTYGLILDLAADIANTIPCCRLKFSKSPEVVKTLELSWTC